MDSALHAAVSALIAVLFESRQIAAAELRLEPDGTRRRPDLSAVLTTMRAEYSRRWKVSDLARLVGLSSPQFFRRFKQATGSSPIDWLRRERVNEAKRRLAETQDRIRDIAEHVGYSDPMYFSRDFKKLVGISPLHYRRQEQAMPLK
jgi:transcriptional regulator GlxA family with amidase domain